MNSSGLKRHKDLAQAIIKEFEKISSEFSHFQEQTKLGCIPGCGRCCFKSDIYCSPMELLPLALELLSRGEAQAFYDKSLLPQEKDRCMFLNVTDHAKFQGTCTEYLFRPLVCRTFGVSARHDKNERVEFSVCRPLKEEKQMAYKNLVEKKLSEFDFELPFIDVCKNRLMSIDMKLVLEELPINQALRIILEQVLFDSSFETPS